MRKRLGEILIAAKVVGPEQLQQVLKLQAKIRQPDLILLDTKCFLPTVSTCHNRGNAG